MALENEQIKEQLTNFSSKHGPAAIVPAEVVLVNEEEATVHVRFSDDSEIEDVRLKAVVTGAEGFYCLPVAGSQIQVARIENSDEYVVVAFSDIDKIVMVKGEVSLKSILNLIIEACQQIVVMQGNNPNYAKLVQAKTQVTNLLK
ncbi:MAG: hypothetical protein EOO10_22270 [Chitinophagaceae bacterium]|nr:MAG: hypothetical protein EOO10_22270 [Chitinophagaceae bacterium]